MFRKLISSRLIIHPGDTQDKFSFFGRLRKYPVLLACLSSGLLYRSYVTLPQHSIYRIQGKIDSSTVHTTGEFVLYSDGQKETSGGPSGSSRAERLVSLRQAVEDDLPEFFNQPIFAFPSSLVDPATIVYVERKNGSLHKLSRSWVTACASATRMYYWARSFHRRIELVTILSDPDKGQLEVGFRIVLIPSPSIHDVRLPKDALMDKLERKARWHEFRATFYVSDAGEITEIRLTRFMPPQKPMETLRSLKQLAMLNRLSPSLPTSRRIPSPTPYLYLDDTTSWRNIAAPYPYTISPSSIFDQLMHDIVLYAPRLTVTPTTCLHRDLANIDDKWEEVPNSIDSPLTVPSLSTTTDLMILPPSVVMLVPSSISVSSILLSADMQLPYCLSPRYSVDRTTSCQSAEQRSSSRSYGGLLGRSRYSSVPEALEQQKSKSPQRHDPLLSDLSVPLLPRLIRKLPDTVMMGALYCASNSSYDSV